MSIPHLFLSHHHLYPLDGAVYENVYILFCIDSGVLLLFSPPSFTGWDETFTTRRRWRKKNSFLPHLHQLMGAIIG